MDRNSTGALILVVSLVLSACTSGPPATNAAGPGATGGNQADGTSGSDPLPLPGRLGVGTLKLEGSANAVTAGQAAELVPLWQALQGLIQSDTSAQAEIDGVVSQINSIMTPAQMHAIAAMNLTFADEASVLTQNGLVVSQGNAKGTPDAKSGIQVFSNGAGGQLSSSGGAVEVAPGPKGGSGGGPQIFIQGGPGGGGPGGLPGSSNSGSGSSAGNESAAQAQRATAQARFGQLARQGLNPILIHAVIDYLQSLGS